MTAKFSGMEQPNGSIEQKTQIKLEQTGFSNCHAKAQFKNKKTLTYKVKVNKNVDPTHVTEVNI